IQIQTVDETKKEVNQMFNIIDKKLINISFGIAAFNVLVLNTFVMAYHVRLGLILLLFSIILMLALFLYLMRSITSSKERSRKIVYGIAGSRKYAVDELPAGLILLNDEDEIDYMNPQILNVLTDDSIGEPINKVFSNIMTSLK